MIRTTNPSARIDESDLLTESQVADLLFISVSGLRAQKARGIGPSWHKLGRKTIYTRADVSEYIESCRVASEPWTD